MGSNARRCLIPYDELYDAYINKKLNTYELAEKFGFTQPCIRNRLKKFNLTWEMQLESYQINSLQHDIIIGNILGDGALHLNKGSIRHYFEIGHTESQLPYLQWKYSMLADLCKDQDMRSRKKLTYDDTYYFYTKSLPIFTRYASMSNVEVLSELNANSLLIWYLDDGYLDKNKYMSISCNRFSFEEIRFTMKHIKDIFGISTVIKYRNKDNGIIDGVRFNREESKQLFNVFKTSDFYHDLLEVIPYKLDFYY